MSAKLASSNLVGNTASTGDINNSDLVINVRNLLMIMIVAIQFLKFSS